MGREQSLAVNRLTSYLTACLNVGRIEITEHHLLSNALSAVSSSMGRGQEYAVLQAVHQHGGKVPRPLLLCKVHRMSLARELLP